MAEPDSTIGSTSDWKGGDWTSTRQRYRRAAGEPEPSPDGGEGALKIAIRPLRILTFNIAHSSVPNLLGPWAGRRKLVTDLIRSARPDVACLQEVSEIQHADLLADLPEFEWFEGPRSGATRMPGALRFAGPALRIVLRDFMDAGERCPILVRKERVHSAEFGTAPVLPMVGVPSSGTPHLVNWIRAIDAIDGTPVTVFNTHLGLLPWRAREAARRILDVVARETGGGLEVIAGDFNSTRRGPALRTLLFDSASGEGRYLDAWSTARVRRGPSWTFHGGLGVAGARIDFVLVHPDVRVAEAEVIVGRTGSRLASDHSALVVELEAGAPPGNRTDPTARARGSGLDSRS